MSDTRTADMNAFNAQIIEEFRANAGVVTGPFQGAPMILLTHTGARSGTVRTTPLVHTRDGNDYIIIASKGGAPTSPAWYFNLLAHPEATIEVGSDTIEVVARVAEGEERQRLYDAQAALMPNFDQYAKATDRVIPVIVLTPKA